MPYSEVRSFTEGNPVSRVMQQMVEELEGYGLEAETAELAEFYASVRRRVEGIGQRRRQAARRG